MIIPFGEYLPDLPEYGNPGLTIAKNCLPYATDYQSFPSMVAFSNAISGVARGFITTRDKDGNTFSYCADTSALYRLSTATWVDSSRTAGGAYQTAYDDNWEFEQFGQSVVATNLTDAVQTITLGASNFAALSGSPPKARHIASVREFLVLGNVTDYSSGASTPNRVHWSGFDSITTWAPAAATQCDYQDLQGDNGYIQRVMGGEYGIIFQERAIWRMTYIGPPIIFQFDQIEPGRGTPAPGSVIKHGAQIYYLGQDDFYKFDGIQSIPIGNNRVYRTFLEDFDTALYHKISAVALPDKPFILWAYPGVGNMGGNPNKILVYNWIDNRWALIESTIERFCTNWSQGYTLDQLDSFGTLDALAYSLDSRAWTGRSLNLAAFDSSHKLNLFTGTAMDAVFEIGERRLFENKRALVTNITPLIDDPGTVTVYAGARNLLTQTASFGAAISVNTDGEAPVMSEGRYHVIRVEVTGGFNHAQGVMADASVGGRY